MKILLLGSGGREHALAWKIAQSPKVEKLYIAPGNAGTGNAGENVAIKATDFDAIKAFALEKGVDMIVVGPEDPLVQGIYDNVKADPKTAHIAVIGPTQAGARLEGSKEFAKQFMQRHGIPTARYKSITAENLDEGIAFLETLEAPYVLKADGLCAGKGVLILPTLDEAKRELREISRANSAKASVFSMSSRRRDFGEFSCQVLKNDAHCNIPSSSPMGTSNILAPSKGAFLQEFLKCSTWALARADFKSNNFEDFFSEASYSERIFACFAAISRANTNPRSLPRLCSQVRAIRRAQMFLGRLPFHRETALLGR